MAKTFNCGIGGVLIVEKSIANQIVEQLCSSGKEAALIGHVEKQIGKLGIKCLPLFLLFTKVMSASSLAHLLMHFCSQYCKQYGPRWGHFGPPLEPKTESCFSPISSDWFIRRIAQV